MTDVSPERQRRFFNKVEGGLQIAKSLRDLCIFARHDLAKDPPFSRLDLISCRNVTDLHGAGVAEEGGRNFPLRAQTRGASAAG